MALAKVEEIKKFHNRMFISNQKIQSSMVKLLELFSLTYWNDPAVTIPGVALSFILTNEQPNDLKKINSLKYPVNQTKMYQQYPTFFKACIDIESLDITLIYELLTKVRKFPTHKAHLRALKQKLHRCNVNATPNLFCCPKCSHTCPNCGKEECDQTCPNPGWDHPCQHCNVKKSQCIEANCGTCQAKLPEDQCGFLIVCVDSLNLFHENRNNISHMTFEDCKQFIEKQITLKEFPQCRTPKELYQNILLSYNRIVNLLTNKNLFQFTGTSLLSFLDRKINLDQMHNILFNNDVNISQEFAESIIKQSFFVTEENKTLRQKIKALEKEHLYNRISFGFEEYHEDGCVLSLDIEIVDVVEIRVFQYRNEQKIELVEVLDYQFQYYIVENISIITVKHAIAEGCKYEYQGVVEDADENKWRCHKDGLDPYDYNWLKLDTINKRKMSPDAHVVSRHPMKLSEKRNCEVTATFSSVGATLVKIAEYKGHDTRQWHKITHLKVHRWKDDIYQMNVILPRGVYDFRVLVEVDAGKYRLFVMQNITVLEKKGFQHATSCQKTLLLSHPLGDKEDASETLKSLSRHGEVGKNGIHVSIHLPGGGETIRDIDTIEDYSEDNFQNQRKMCFPPFYTMSADSSHVKIAKLLDVHLRSLERERFIILPKVDIKESLKILGFTKDQIKQLFDSEFGDEWQITFVTVVFDIDTRTVLLITLCKNGESLQKTHIQCDRIVKAFLTVSQNLIGESLIAVVGVVSSLESNREMVKNFCHDCSPHILTMEEIQNSDLFRNWFYDLSNNVHKQVRLHFNQPLEESCNDRQILKIANRLMLLISIMDFSLPVCIGGTDDDKINKLLLTSEQIHAVYDDQHKKKVIKGNYGSGKTLVIKKKMQILNNEKSPEDVIYYINWDPYSLINVEMYKATESFRQGRVICKNICQLSEEARSQTVFSLSQCLRNISDAHPNQTAHVLIDEYDEEKLSKEEEGSISNILTMLPTFKDAHVLVSVQSVAKERKSYLSKTSKPSVYKKGCWEGSGMTIYMLPHTMRFTNRINNVVQNFQKEVTMQPNIYFASLSPKKDSSNRPVPFDQNSELSSGVVNFDQNLSLTKVVSTPSESLTPQLQEDVKLRPEQNIDTLAIQAGIKEEDAGGNSRLETTFRYKSCVSGHKIKGLIPKLMRVDVSHDINVDLMKHFIESCFSDYKKALVICNDLALMTTLVEVFEKIGNIHIIQYFDNLMENLPPSFERQKFVYKQLMSEEKRNLLLLTDSRGCRGLENKNVICIIDEREDFERHLVIENICRATCNLHLLSFQDDSQETNTRRIVQFLLAENYLKDITENCIKRCSTNNVHSVKIMDKRNDNKQFEVIRELQKLVFSELTEEDKEKNWTFRDLDVLIENRNYTKIIQLISILPSKIHLRGDIDGIYRFSDNNLLHSASYHYSDVDFVQHLINERCSLKENNSHGWMPIHLAAAYNRVGIVKVMLDNDPSLINEKIDDNFNMTSLHQAAIYNRKEVVHVLLQHPNIDVNIEEFHGMMADEFDVTNDEIKRMIQQHREYNSL